ESRPEKEARTGRESARFLRRFRLGRERRREDGRGDAQRAVLEAREHALLAARGGDRGGRACAPGREPGERRAIVEPEAAEVPRDRAGPGETHVVVAAERERCLAAAVLGERGERRSGPDLRRAAERQHDPGEEQAQ